MVDREPRPLAAVQGAAEGLRDGLADSRLAEATDQALRQGGRLAKAAVRRPRTRAAIDRSVRRTRRRVRHAITRTREGAAAVAESTRRAARAPPRILTSLRQAGAEWAGGMAKGLALYAAAGAVALAAFAALTVAFVVGLDLLLGRPWGAFLVAIAYGLAAVAVALAARRSVRRGKAAARRRVQDARRDAEDVVAPLRDLGRHRHTRR